MIWKYLVTRSGMKILLKMLIVYDCDLQWIDLSKNRSLLSVSLTIFWESLLSVSLTIFWEEKCNIVFSTASDCIPRYWLHFQWVLSPCIKLYGQSGNLPMQFSYSSRCSYYANFCLFLIGWFLDSKSDILWLQASLYISHKYISIYRRTNYNYYFGSNFNNVLSLGLVFTKLFMWYT